MGSPRPVPRRRRPSSSCARPPTDSFIPAALHAATWFSVGVLMLALVIVVIWLPTKAQAAAWGPSAAPTAIPAAGAPPGGLVRTADETDGDLARMSLRTLPGGAPAPVHRGRHATPDQAMAVPLHHRGRHAQPESPLGVDAPR